MEGINIRYRKGCSKMEIDGFICQILIAGMNVLKSQICNKYSYRLKNPIDLGNYNCNPITEIELQTRSRNSKPIYFDYCNFISSHQHNNPHLSIDYINCEMVYQFLVRDHQKFNYSPTTCKVEVTDAHKKTVLESMNALKSFFTNKG